MGRILVVDDEDGLRAYLAEALAGAGHEVTTAGTVDEALARLASQAFHVVLTDLRMPGAGGMAIVRKVRGEQPETEVIVLTAYGSVDTAVEAMKLGAFDYLQKPIAGPGELRLVVARAVERHQLVTARDRAGLEAPVPTLTWGDPTMAPVVDAVRRVAPTQATVLLVGESGTGKEVCARAIHQASARARGPFVAVNCAALSASLLESELFGHEKGAFTGATERRRGRIELADGGTFFLDEVGELLPELQAKLLRAVQERQIERVGSTRTIDVDVRWIAATNRNLTAMMKAGTFREDLYHRLAVFPIQLPPLRARRADIGPLADELLARICRELKRPALVLDGAARAAIVAAEWPGNVRELANVLERAVILCDRDVIGVGDLWLETGPRGDGAGGVAVTLDGATLDDLERRAIEAALAAHGGNRRRAAAQLRIGLRTLYDKLKRYGLT
jgi:two-component system response regulator FlrC